MVVKKKLLRSSKDQILAGVCSGLGEYLNIDPTVIRIIAVLLTLATAVFPGLLVYFIFALIIPSK